MAETTGIKNPNDLLCAGLDTYHKYIELALNLLAPFVDSKKILNKAAS